MREDLSQVVYDPALESQIRNGRRKRAKVQIHPRWMGQSMKPEIAKYDGGIRYILWCPKCKASTWHELRKVNFKRRKNRLVLSDFPTSIKINKAVCEKCGNPTEPIIGRCYGAKALLAKMRARKVRF